MRRLLGRPARPASGDTASSRRRPYRWTPTAPGTGSTGCARQSRRAASRLPDSSTGVGSGWAAGITTGNLQGLALAGALGADAGQHGHFLRRVAHVGEVHDAVRHVTVLASTRILLAHHAVADLQRNGHLFGLPISAVVHARLVSAETDRPLQVALRVERVQLEGNRLAAVGVAGHRGGEQLEGLNTGGGIRRLPGQGWPGSATAPLCQR